MERHFDYGELVVSAHLGEETADRIGCKKTRRLHHNFGNRQDKLGVEHIVHCGDHGYNVVDYADVVDGAAGLDVAELDVVVGVAAPDAVASAVVVDDTGVANPAPVGATPQTEKGDQKEGWATL
jgi:hypothetical protein